jgi:ATP-dependent RNA helicase DDX21
VATNLRTAAKQFIESCSSPVEALAKALAKITGITAMRPRSLINADEGVVTMLFTCEHEVATPSSIWGYLRFVCSRLSWKSWVRWFLNPP